MFRTPGPPALTSQTYTRDFDEVKRLGSTTSTACTADQTDAALWWHDRRSVSWGIKRDLAVTQRLDVLETARFYALADVTGADGSMVAGPASSCVARPAPHRRPQGCADADWS